MKRGEIWLADLGMTAKLRPVLLLSVPYSDEERAIITYVPRTTSVWPESRFDVTHRAPGMVPGAFAVQLLGSVSNALLVRKLGAVDSATLQRVEGAVRLWLNL